ncbi:hypothetical protein [Streptomyces sennicomposti]|uniref:hypothetical protein n=1 Tax=Streptomyces sennicomposti TaxID=2873384 RepID=UPI001CA728E4|nr:hypothetical protein [Streptomyces sennicomposti]MBY8864398.1 hypothetical protein [Streptomyces sennicomposti]
MTGTVLAAHPGDTEAALVEYERALLARGAESVTFDGAEVHGIDSENDTAQAMLQMITARNYD